MPKWMISRTLLIVLAAFAIIPLFFRTRSADQLKCSSTSETNHERTVLNKGYSFDPESFFLLPDTLNIDIPEVSFLEAIVYLRTGH